MIVVPAIHPAHEVIARVATLRPGDVQRAREVLTGLGGKALNTARFAAALGAPVRLVVVGDDRLLGLIGDDPDLGRETVAVTRIPSAAPTRTDVAVVDEEGRLTVLNGTSAHPGAAAVARLVEATLAGLGPDDLLVLAGSTPLGTDEVYPRLIAAARRAGARVLVDASGPWLRTALEAGPDIVKISAAEAASLGLALPAIGVPAADPARDPAPRPAGAPEDELRSGWRSPVRPLGLGRPETLGITHGERGLRAWLADGRAVLVTPPGGLDVVNPLGAGDAVTAGLAIELDRGGDALDGFGLGTAIAAARLRRLETRVSAAEVAELLPRVGVVPLG